MLRKGSNCQRSLFLARFKALYCSLHVRFVEFDHFEMAGLRCWLGLSTKGRPDRFAFCWSNRKFREADTLGGVSNTGWLHAFQTLGAAMQIIDPEKYEKKRHEKGRQRAEEKAARQAAAQKRYKKREKAEEEEPEGNARFTRSARSRTFTTVSFTGATGPVAEPVPEETGQGEGKEEKAEPEEPHRKRGKKKNAEAGGAPIADANGGEGGAGPSGRQEESGGGGAPGIAVLVKAPLVGPDCMD
jgi:hypothetical protein